MSKKRKLKQLKAWAKLAASNKLLVGIAGSANSPNQAYELAYVEAGDAKLAQSCRWLAMMKRDHGKKAFDSFVSSVASSRPRSRSTGRKKGAGRMSKQKVELKPKGKEADTSPPSIPLKHIAFRTALKGAFARVRCEQVFENDAENPVEAVYVFPFPDDASVTGCEMRIGRRRVKAELKESKAARREYDEAISQGHHGALLEQERPNIFTMNVGGIEPGEKIKVTVDYVQRIPWQAGGGRYRIPLVVAPQFIPGVPTGEKQGGGWSEDTDEVPDASRITPNVAKEGVPYNADISISFSPGFRCKLSCPSHPAIIQEQTVAKKDTVELKTGDIRTDRDFTLVYTSVSKVPEVAVHAGSLKKENFLLASIIPPGESQPVGSDYILVLDCSGSMRGAKIDGLRIIAKKIVQGIKQQDIGHRVGIIPFNTRPLPVHPLSPVNEATEQFIDSLYTAGQTYLGFALDAAKQMLTAQDSNRPKAILVVTDGDTEHARNWYGDGIRLIGIGIDSAVNDTHINVLTKRNHGVAEFVFPGEDYGAVSGRMTGYLSGPVLQGVSVDTKGEAVGVSDVFKGRPATIAVRFPGKAENIKITGTNPEGKEVSWDISAKGAKECDFAPQVWARDLIRENPTERERQVKVSLEFGVVCQHTSFVAISEKKAPGKKPERVEIPVNLPDGWVYNAVLGADRGVMAAGLMGGPAVLRSMSLGAPSSFSRSVRARRGAGPLMRGTGGGGFKGATPVEMLDCGDPTGDDLLRSIDASPPVDRFKLDSTDLVDRLVAVLNAVLRNNRTGAEEAFEALKKELTVRKAKALSPEKKATAYYFCLRLMKHGLKLDSKVMTELSGKPDKSDLPASAWYNLALKEQGRPFEVKRPIVWGPADYVEWKFGLGPKPTSGEWADVL